LEKTRKNTKKIYTNQNNHHLTKQGWEVGGIGWWENKIK